MEHERAGAERKVTRIVVQYRTKDGEERTLTMEHTGTGVALDGVSWNTALVNKLVYRENGKYVEPRKERGGQGWRVTDEADGSAEAGTAEAGTSEAGTAESEAGGAETMSALGGPPPNCFWYHHPDCMWQEICGTE